MSINRKRAHQRAKKRVIDLSPTLNQDELYPDPPDALHPDRDSHVRTPFGTEYYDRVWMNKSGEIVHFSIILNVAKTHRLYPVVKRLKRGRKDWLHIFRVDTWHSSIHKHQYYAYSFTSDREVLVELSGGDMMRASEKAVDSAYREQKDMLQESPQEVLRIWEGEKR